MPARRSLISIPRALRFLQTVEMDVLIPVRGLLILHIVDRWSRISFGRVIQSRGTDDILACMFEFFSIFGLPERLKADGERAVVSEEVGKVLTSLGVKLSIAPPDSHHYIGCIERRNGTLERCMMKMREQNETWSWSTILRYSLFSINNCVDEAGTSPQMRVFGKNCILTPVNEGTETHFDRMKRIEKAAYEANRMEAVRVWKRAMRAKRQKAMPLDKFEGGEMVEIWCEKSRQWDRCPAEFVAYQGNGKLVCRRGGRWYEREPRLVRRHIKIDGEKDLEEIFFHRCLEDSVFIVVVTKEEAKNDPGWRPADRKEVDGLISTSTFRVELKKDVAHLPAMPLLCRRIVKDDEEKTKKTRLCAAESTRTREIEDVTTPCPERSLVRLMLHFFITRLAMGSRVSMRSFDIKQAYLQSANDNEQEEVRAIIPKDEALWEVLPESWKDPRNAVVIQGALYGLRDSGNRWYRTISTFLRSLGFITDPSAPTLFFKRGKGYICLYVDDGLVVMTGTGIESEIDALRQRFPFGSEKTWKYGEKIKFTGIPTELQQGPKIEVDMNGYAAAVKKLDSKNTLSTNAEKDAFRAITGAYGWLSTIVKPQLSFPVSKANAKINDGEAGAEYLRLVQKRFNPSNNTMRFVPLREKAGTLHLYCHSDASLFNAEEHASQGGFVIFAGEQFEKGETKKMNCNIMHWRSQKIRRVTKSTFSSELLSLSAAVDETLHFRDMAKAFYDEVEVTFVIDCRSLCANMHNANPKVTEKRLLGELNYVREALREVGAKLFHVPGTEMVADPLTKDERFNEALHRMIETNTINCAEWT